VEKVGTVAVEKAVVGPVEKARVVASTEARQEFKETTKETAQAASETAIASAIPLAVEAALTEASLKEQMREAKKREQHEAEMASCDAAWLLKLTEATNNAHAWAERAGQLETAEAKALEELASARDELATILVTQLAKIRWHDWLEERRIRSNEAKAAKADKREAKKLMRQANKELKKAEKEAEKEAKAAAKVAVKEAQEAAKAAIAARRNPVGADEEDG